MNFEIVRIGDECMAVPVGDEATSFHGVITLSEPAAFVLDLLSIQRSDTDLIDKLCEEYDVSRSVAEADMKKILAKFRELNLITDH